MHGSHQFLEVLLTRLAGDVLSSNVEQATEVIEYNHVWSRFFVLGQLLENFYLLLDLLPREVKVPSHQHTDIIVNGAIR